MGSRCARRWQRIIRFRRLNPYSHSKILAEEACGFYSEHHGLRIATVRPFNIYGPGQNERFLIPTLVRQALDATAGKIEVADDRPRRDFLFVSDFVDLLWRRSTRRLPVCITPEAAVL
jgi:nucleoside-diphosphate-sugar epimerase